MAMTTWSIDELCQVLRREDELWIRAVAAADAQVGDEWQIHFMEVTAGAPPPTWKEAEWSYTKAVLRSTCEPGEVVARWLAEGRVPFGTRSVEWKIQDRFQVNRHASKAHSGGYEPLLWPCVEMTIGGSAQTSGYGMILVADDAPPFFDLGSAAAALLGLEVQLGRMAQSWQASFRQQDLSARICGITVSPTRLIVDLDGSELAGATLDLGTPRWHQRALVESHGSQSVVFDLSGSLPQGSWVVLHRAQDWIDIRYLNYPWARRMPW